jgi:prepilin-type N-terminal cleavage/methylation domain-containing protein
MHWLHKAKQRINSKEEGFTLIELMIVVVIIGVLAAIAIPIFANQQKAAINASTKSSIRELRNAIEIARVKTSKPLIQITGATCTGCAFNSVDPLTLSKSGAQWIRYTTSLQRISDASGVDVTNLVDGYGRPLHIDENEAEGASCSNDVISSYQDPWISTSYQENGIKLSIYTTACTR